MKKLTRFWPLLATVAIVSLWLFWPQIFPIVLARFNLPRGGEKDYDPLNVLFAGLGIVGLLYTLFLQRVALRDQKVAQTESELRLLENQRLLTNQLEVLRQQFEFTKERAHREGIPVFTWRDGNRTDTYSNANFQNDGGDILNVRLINPQGTFTTGSINPSTVPSGTLARVHFNFSVRPERVTFEIEYTHRSTGVSDRQRFVWARGDNLPQKQQ